MGLGWWRPMRSPFLLSRSQNVLQWWLGFALLVMGFFVGSRLYGYLFGAVLSGMPPFIRLPTKDFLVFGSALLLTWMVSAWLFQRPFGSLFRPKGERWRWRHYAIAMLCYAVLMGALVMLASAWMSVPLLNPLSGQGLVSVLLTLATMLFATPLQTLTEEVMFRGYVLQATSALSRRPILLVSINAVLFALMHFQHVLAGHATWLSLLLIQGSFGLFATIVTLRSDGIEFSAGAHAAHNLGCLLLFDVLAKGHSGSLWGFVGIQWVGFLVMLVLFELFATRRAPSYPEGVQDSAKSPGGVSANALLSPPAPPGADSVVTWSEWLGVSEAVEMRSPSQPG